MRLFLAEATLKKKNETFNVYSMELSFGELKMLYDLTQSSTGAMVDEFRANLEYYFKRLPPPGVDEPKKGDEGEKKPEAEPGAPKVEEPDAGEPDTKMWPVDGEGGEEFSDPESPMPGEEQVLGPDADVHGDLDVGAEELPDPTMP